MQETTRLQPPTSHLYQLYECGTNDADINCVLEDIQRDSNSHFSMLLLQDDVIHNGTRLFSSGLSHEKQQHYLKYYQNDIWLNQYLEKQCQGVVSAYDLIAENNLLNRLGAAHAIGGSCRVPQHGVSTISSYREHGTPFSQLDMLPWEALYHGLAAWSRHYWTLTALQSQNSQLEYISTLNQHATALVDKHGAIHYCNATFNRLIDENPELGIQQGQFLIHNKDCQRHFYSMLSSLSGLLPGNSSTVLIPRGRGARPMLLKAKVIDGLRNMERYIELRLRDPDSSFSLDIKALESLYSLTGSEKELALLLSKGYRTDDIARMRGVSVDTTRATLKNIFKKTDCHSQSELLLLLQSIS